MSDIPRLFVQKTIVVAEKGPWSWEATVLFHKEHFWSKKATFLGKKSHLEEKGPGVKMEPWGPWLGLQRGVTDCDF